MLFRHEDKMQYERVTAGKTNHLFAVGLCLAGLALGAYGFTQGDNAAINLAIMAFGASIVFKIISKIQGWFWN